MAEGTAFRLVPDAGRPSVADWEAEAARVLRRAGRLAADDPDDRVWPALTTDLPAGVAVSPLGVSLEGLPDPALAGGQGVWPDQGWDVRTWHVGPTAAETADGIAADLAGGATSVWLTLAGGGLTAADLPALLTDVPDDVGVVLDAPDDPLGAARALLAERSGADVHPGVDPLGTAVRRATAPDLHLATEAGRLARDHACWGPLVDATAVHEQGGAAWLELGYAMAAGTAYLRATGGSFAALEFRFAATDDVLLTTATLRAARRMWARVARECDGPPAMTQHAVTSRPMVERRDPWTNLVRGTLAAVGAAMGGADALTVLPYDAGLGVPSAHGRRLARTTQEVLLAEADLGRVADPAGGSYTLEAMTDGLARAGWAAFRRLEEAGGIVPAMESGLLAELLADGRAARRGRDVVGVTLAPAPDGTATRPAYPSGLSVAEPWSAW